MEDGEQKLRRIFAQRLQTERRERRFTQEQLADRIGRSVDLISRLERSAAGPSLETLVLLGEAFEIDPASLLTFGAQANNYPNSKISGLLDLLLSFSDNDLARVRRVIEALK